MEIPRKGDLWAFSSSSVEVIYLIVDDPVYQAVNTISVTQSLQMAYVFKALRIANPYGYSTGKDLQERIMRIEEDGLIDYWKKVS